MELNANHTVSHCHLSVSCTSLVDRCGSFGSYKPHIKLNVEELPGASLKQQRAEDSGGLDNSSELYGLCNKQDIKKFIF